MAKSRSRTADLASYLALKAIAGSLLAMPMEWAVGLIRWLAHLAYRIDRRHREVAFDNLRHAFPGRYSERQLTRLVRGVYEHFALLLLEMLLIPRKLRAGRLERFFKTLENTEYFR